MGKMSADAIWADRAHPISGVGQHGFVARHGLYTDEQAAAAEIVAARISELDLRTVRLVIVDQNGVPRSKSLRPDVAIAAMSNGLDFSGAIYSLDAGGHVFVPPFAAGGGFGIEELTGFPDCILVPDAATFQILPWADRTGWMLCDIYFPSGRPVPLDGRGVMRRALCDLAEAGYDYLAGLEIEFYIFKLDSERVVPEEAGFTPPPPAVSVFQRGYRYLSEVRHDAVADTLEVIRDGLAGIGLDPRAMEDEIGPGQMEFSFNPIMGLAAADAVVMFRSAVKQMCQRRGLLATFMCRPALPEIFPSGWHLHQSLISQQDGRNAFASRHEALSAVGRHYVAGLLEHAMPMTSFATPTVNGYTRYRPYSFAPDRVCWATENRGALVRVQGAPGDVNSHLENRMAEPAANPYLHMAANIAAGLDGIRRQLNPSAPVEGDPYATQAPLLPTSLADAVNVLERDAFFRKTFGETLIDYLIQMKRAELARHAAAIAENPPADGRDVSDWEMREYFEFY
jgi:glutamine synthetase